jgi:hypothetical protein
MGYFLSAFTAGCACFDGWQYKAINFQVGIESSTVADYFLFFLFYPPNLSFGGFGLGSDALWVRYRGLY